MPDLSLFNPLCEELNISINELMKGEKINNDNYQKAFEENIVNTINYSNKTTNKKIKKITILFILLFVLLIGYIFFFNGGSVLVKNDTYPVYEKVEIDKKVIDPVLSKYILDNMLQPETNKLKNVASFEIFSIEKKKENNYYVYAWVIESSYEIDNEVLRNQGSSSYPCRFELIKENNIYKVVNADAPRDGSYYVKDLKKYFPKYVRDEIDKVHDENEFIIKKLDNENIKKAKDFFGLS